MLHIKYIGSRRFTEFECPIQHATLSTGELFEFVEAFPEDNGILVRRINYPRFLTVFYPGEYEEVDTKETSQQTQAWLDACIQALSLANDALESLLKGIRTGLKPSEDLTNSLIDLASQVAKAQEYFIR